MKPLEPPVGGLYVHDFVRVDLPFDAAVGAFSYYVSAELISMLVSESWKSELAEAGRAFDGPDVTADGDRLFSVEVELGRPRARQGALVVPVSWRADSEEWVPSLQADLEVIGFGPGRSHLHVMGLSDLAPGSVPCTDRASLDHRLTVALVRQVLMSLAELLAAPMPDQVAGGS